MVLRDLEFNHTWIRSWTTHLITSTQLLQIREQVSLPHQSAPWCLISVQFGDAVALYFIFLSSYTKALVFPAILGVLFYFFGTPYSPLYSILLVLWSIGFVEWWRVTERIIAMRHGTRGSFRVEKRRARYIAGFSWWVRDIRMATCVPVILLFIAVLAALLTGIFAFEAFVTQLYTGPGHKYIVSLRSLTLSLMLTLCSLSVPQSYLLFAFHAC
jgi:anoctamin-10